MVSTIELPEELLLLLDALGPPQESLVLAGGWAHRLYWLHSAHVDPGYSALMTQDVDVVLNKPGFTSGELLNRLRQAGFEERLLSTQSQSSQNPPVARYQRSGGSAGLYAEFLSPLTGSGLSRTGVP